MEKAALRVAFFIWYQQVETFCHEAIDAFKFALICQYFARGLNIGCFDDFVPTVIDQCPGCVGRCFQVELQCEDLIAYRECLILTGAAFGKVRCASGKVISVAMPVKDFTGLCEQQPDFFMCLHALNGKPADFFVVVGIDSGSEYVGYELGTQADAEYMCTGIYCLFQKFLLSYEPWVVAFVIDAHRSPHDDQ